MYKAILKSAILVCFTLSFILTAGCNFDTKRQLDQRFPVTLIIKNDTAGTVIVDNILSIPQAENTLVLKGGPITPAGSITYRISEADCRVILAGAFVLHGTCDGRKNWEVSGVKLPRKEVHDAQRWDVTASILTCAP
ncbi:MAG TPA: hypothetical protein VK448_08250 [Dissulfurispiraceae bacterium]|nr:hypothetical protein [Dissulfurispiraceae bacterium]